MATRLWTPSDLAVQPVSWLDCDTCRTDTDTGGIVGVYDKEGHSFRPMSGYGYTIGESHINGRRWLGAVSPRDGSYRLSLGCMTASGWFQGKPGVTVVGAWWRFTLANLYGGMIAINNVDANGTAATTQAQAMVKVSPSSISTGGILYNWRRLSTDTRTQSTCSTGLPAADCGLVLSTRLDAQTAKASLRVGTSAAWGSLEAQSGITPGMLAGCSRSAYQVMYGFERANMSGNQDMALGESLIYAEALSDADVAKIEGYLAHKWGVTDSLPASHPYKSTPPVVDVPEPAVQAEESAVIRYREWLPKQAPAWLQKTNGSAWHWAIGDEFDRLDDLAHTAALCRFPDFTTRDGLSYLGGERGITRGPLDTDAEYAAKIKASWVSKQAIGTPKGVLLAVNGILGENIAQIKTNDGYTYSLNTDNELITTTPAVTADDDEVPVRWATTPDLWHVFQVFIPWGAEAFEDGIPAPDAAIIQKLRSAILRSMGGHCWCDGIVCINEYGSGAGNGRPRIVDNGITVEEMWEQDSGDDAWFDREPAESNRPRGWYPVSETGRSGEGGNPMPEVTPPAPAADLLTGLAHFWGGGSSTSVLDLSDAVEGGWALTNAADWTGNAAAAATGIFGGAFGIDTASKYIYSTSKNFLAEDCSIAFWVKPLSTPTGGARFARIPAVRAVGHTGWAGTPLDIIAPTPSSWYRLGIQCVPGSDPAVTVEADAPASFAVGSWNLLVLTWDAAAGVATLWANGEKLIEATGTFIADDNTKAFGIAGASNGNGVPGTYDELAVWTRVLGQAEVTALWAGGAGLPFADWT